MKSTTTATYRTMADIQAQSAMNLRHLTLRFAMLTALLMMAVGVKAQVDGNHKYRIVLSNNNSYVIKPTGDGYLNELTSNPTSDDSYWYFEKGGITTDGATYYYIRNHSTLEYWFVPNTGNEAMVMLSATNKSPFVIIEHANKGKYAIAPLRGKERGANPLGGAGGNRVIGLYSTNDGNSQWIFDGVEAVAPAAPSAYAEQKAFRIRGKNHNTWYLAPKDGVLGEKNLDENAKDFYWSFEYSSTVDEKDYFHIVNFATGEYLYYDSSVNAAGSIKLSTTTKGEFCLTDRSGETNGGFIIQPKGHSYFNPYGGPGNNIGLYSEVDDPNSQWEFTDETYSVCLGVKPQAGSTYSYRIGSSNQYMSATYHFIQPIEDKGTFGCLLKQNQPVNMEDDSKQYWYLEDAGDGYYYIANRNTGQYMYKSSSAEDNGKSIQLADGEQRTRFKVETIYRTYNNTMCKSYTIMPEGSTGYSLNPDGGANGSMNIYGKDDANSQWYFLTDNRSVAPPTITLSAGKIAITTTEAGATIYYTTDGSWPAISTTRQQYTTELPADQYYDKVKAIAVKGINSAVAVESQKTPDLTLYIEGDYTEITITSTEETGTLYYDVQGNEPTLSSPSLASGQSYTFTTAGGTLKVFALKEGLLRSKTVTGFLPLARQEISSLSEITHPNGYYILTGEADISGEVQIDNFTGVLDGNYHTISELTKPLFASTDGATIKNVTIKKAQVTGSGNVGAIVGTASGDTRIYNCGVLSGSVSGGTNVGSIAGLIEDNARVINSYSFANVSGGTTAGGIVGYNSVASTANNLQTLVMNCMYYGNVTNATNCYPIYGGEKISNAGANGINNYNYYRHEAMTVDNGYYNCALAAEELYLTRFEFYRHILNSHRELCAFYAIGHTGDYEEIGKWVLDESAGYPIIKPWGKYASAINKHNTKVLGTLAVSISGQNATGNSLSQNLTLNITDIDAEIHDYNYYKVQLPYYNDYFDDNYTNNKVVTGWKITSITGGNTGELTTTGNNRYNFADRNCTAKDLYSTSGRVLAQGGYFNVPEGVTAITIEPYWGKAVYLCDATYDVTYSSSYTEYPSHTAGATPNTFNDQPVYNRLDDVWGQLANSSSVYDNAIVLCGNFHSYSTTAIWSNGTKGFTLMSVDKNKDNEPDYSLYFKSGVRLNINPVRFDFINHVGIGRAAKVDGTTMMPNIGIFGPKGWFEITETALALYTEFEYQVNDKTLAPLILNGGIYEQFCSALYGGDRLDKTSYIIVGGNCYFNYYAPGCQSGAAKQTAFPPVTILGGEYKEFYLSGVKPDINPIDNYNALCYGNGGRIGTFAGAYQEQIDGDVIIKLDHMTIDEFYGGGTNDKKPITGNINVTINNSKVGIYCGGPKFGNMSEGKTVTTSATNTTFDTFYGGGYGGTSLYSDKTQDSSGQTTYNADWFNDFSTDRGKYRQISEDNSDKGILTSYAMEYFNYSGGDNNNARFYTLFASLSVAEVRNVNTMLTDCTIRGDLYGGGCLGKATGAITTTLNNCTIGGNVFAGGYSATAPTCNIMPATPPTFSTYNGNTGTYTPAVYPTPEAYKWTQATSPLAENTLAIEETNGEKRIYTYVIDLSDLGTIRGNTSLTITGNTLIDGSVYGGGNMSKVVDGQTSVIINGKGVVINESVFGGGNQAEVTGNTNVHIKDGRINGNVYGGGNQAVVTGKTAVTIGDSNNPEFNLGDEKTDIELGAPERNSNRSTATE